MATTTAAVLGDSQIALMDKAFLIEATDQLIIDQFVDIKRDINAKSIDLPKYAKLALATTALTDGTDVTATAMSDTKVTLTPAEYGAVVSTTKLANLQTGGKADLGAAAVVGQNMGETLNALGCIAGAASTNIKVANGAVSEAAIVATDLIQASDLNYVHNRLHRNNIKMFPGDQYIAIAHPDVLEDVKASSSFESVAKYANALQIMRNEIGSYKGFRWVSTAGMQINADAGSTTVDTYDTLFLGKNALGKAVSFNPVLKVTGPFDSLGRLVNLGWYAVVSYGIIDQAALWVITSASSFGANT